MRAGGVAAIEAITRSVFSVVVVDTNLQLVSYHHTGSTLMLGGILPLTKLHKKLKIFMYMYVA